MRATSYAASLFGLFGAGAIVLGACDHPRAETAPPRALPQAAAVETAPAADAAASAPPSPPFPGPERVTAEDAAMGTHLAYASFTTPTRSADDIHAAFDAATAEIKRVEALMTTWRPDSDISRVNAAAGTSKVVVDPETYAVVAESVHTSEISEGTFDITFETLHGVWKFDEDLDPHPPKPEQVKARLKYVGYRHIHLDPKDHSIFVDDANTKISLGGIAKGYAVDRAAKVLEDAGLASFYVQAGGDLYARGTKPDGSEWSAGVRDPRGADGSFFALLPLRDHAFSTAGDYERSYVVGKKRYHHIIDPRTGYPATASRSVTIYAPTAFLADAIDDAVFILGPEKGLKLVESLDGVGAVIVDAKNNLWVSKRLQGKLRVVGVPTDGI